MQRIIFFCLINCIWFLTPSCSKNSNNQQLTEFQGIKLGRDSLYFFYNQLPELHIPYAWEENKYFFDENYHLLPPSLYPLFRDSLYLYKVHIAKLPVVLSLRPILFYQIKNKIETVDLYSLSNQLDIIDSIQLVSTEILNEKSKITQTFIIIEKDKFKSFKLLDNTLIEQRYYIIDSEGKIGELKEEDLPFINYKIYQDSLFQIEYFIYDKNNIKKDISYKYYILDKNGKMKETMKE